MAAWHDGRRLPDTYIVPRFQIESDPAGENFVRYAEQISMLLFCIPDNFAYCIRKINVKSDRKLFKNVLKVFTN